MERQALKRCEELDLGFSKYVQKLIAWDLSNKLLAEIAVNGRAA